MFAYSARKNTANIIPEYSTWKPADDLALALGHVERVAVGLGEAGDEVDDEEREAAAARTSRRSRSAPSWRATICGEVHALPGHERAHEREAHGELVGDHLRARRAWRR